jgi:type II secretory pathway component PulJ
MEFSFTFALSVLLAVAILASLSVAGYYALRIAAMKWRQRANRI